ncbi:hypothetical protein ACFX16_026580 [Malus domestica]
MIRILGQSQNFKFPMFHSSLIGFLLLNFLVFHVEAQPTGIEYSTDEQLNFQPSVALVIGVLAIFFLLTFFLLVYVKFCHRRAYVVGNNHLRSTGLVTASARFSGIDKTVIEALPFFKFSSLKGSKEGLECAVCLSKFEDIEILRLLPKCKHAFHISCIDYWLEKHSSCPLCRHRVSSEDLTSITYSNSMRWINQSERRQDSNIELFVQREEDHSGSSRFSVGSSFRKVENAIDKELLIQGVADVTEEGQKVLHKHKHKIVVSDLEFKNRWSNVSSSDLLFLNSEMLNTMSSDRFSFRDLNDEQFSPTKATGNQEIVKIREEMEMKRLFEDKFSTMSEHSSALVPSASVSIETSAHASSSVNQGEKRSMSEITGLSRFGNLGSKNRTRELSLLENNAKEERMRRLWLPIARRTVHWFANREKRSPQPQRPLDMIKMSGFQDFNLPMFHSSLFVLLLNSVVFHVESQAPDVSSDEGNKYQSGVHMVIGVLSIMFSITFVLLLYAKYCYRRVPARQNSLLETGLITSSSRFSGIDKTLIEVLPFFRFSSLKGSKEGLECAVCLSKFEDIEILRLLPKCKHAFHISCIDNWLEKHSSCPLCRHRVSSEDLTFDTLSNSMRVLSNNQSEHRQDSSIDLFVRREEDRHSSSRFSVGRSFRKSKRVVEKEDELLIKEEASCSDVTKEDDKILHKHKHKILFSALEFNNRWSNLSPSDLMFLNSEMLNTVSSNRFSPTRLNDEQFLTAKATGNEEIMKIREEMEMKRLFENKVSTMNKNSSATNSIVPSTSDSTATSAHASSSTNLGEKRSMSEITALSRFGNLGSKNRAREPSLLENNAKEERMRRLWMPIARRTVQSFANREKRCPRPLDV